MQYGGGRPNFQYTDPDISETVKARDFKFGEHIAYVKYYPLKKLGHRGKNEVTWLYFTFADRCE